MKRTPLKKVGKRAKRYASGDTKFRLSVRTNAQGFCERCGEPGTEAHHYKTRATSLSLRHEPRNGVFLCTPCHRSAHAKPSEFRSWFEKTRPADLAFIRGVDL